MRKILCLLMLLATIGCATTQSNPILTSSEEKWYIPKNTEFKAKKTQIDNLTVYTAQDDLIVMYFGEYQNIQKQADSCSK